MSLYGKNRIEESRSKPACFHIERAHVHLLTPTSRNGQWPVMLRLKVTTHLYKIRQCWNSTVHLFGVVLGKYSLNDTWWCSRSFWSPLQSSLMDTIRELMQISLNQCWLTNIPIYWHWPKARIPSGDQCSQDLKINASDFKISLNLVRECISDGPLSSTL